MSTGIPRTSREVTREAVKLGYKYSHATGGHLFYTKANPDADIGQSSKLCIPSDIKTEKTLRSILKGMAYFKANNLDHAGHPVQPDPAVQAAQQQKLADSRFVQDLRDWKSHMKRHIRGIEQYPGHAPAKPGAPRPA
jgi:predicted RNA binding protein YcfA (HicA-like mRNA interferase family)